MHNLKSVTSGGAVLYDRLGGFLEFPYLSFDHCLLKQYDQMSNGSPGEINVAINYIKIIPVSLLRILMTVSDGIQIKGLNN